MTAASSAPRNAGGVGYVGRLYLGPTVHPAAAANNTAVKMMVYARLNHTGELLMPDLRGSDGRRRPRPVLRDPDPLSSPWLCLCLRARSDAIGTRRQRRSRG